MDDIFEAVEKLSAILGIRLTVFVRRWGWIATTQTSTRDHPRGGPVTLTQTMIRMPAALVVRFAPRALPDPGERTWTIEIRRADGYVRRSWRDGVQVGQHEGRYMILHQGAPLDDAKLRWLFDELNIPGPDGIVRDIQQTWARRFGNMAPLMYEAIQLCEERPRLNALLEAVEQAADGEAAWAKFNEIFPPDVLARL